MNTAADVPEDSVMSDTSVGDASKSVITTVSGPYVLMQGLQNQTFNAKWAVLKWHSVSNERSR